MKNLSLQIAKGSMSILCKGAGTGDIERYGISPEEFKKVTGPAPWGIDDRDVVEKVLEVIQYGIMDMQRLPRFDVPAEYKAGVIAMIVHPVNLMAACRFMEVSDSQAQLSKPDGEGSDPVRAARLFSLVLGLVNDSHTDACKGIFEKRTGLAIAKTKQPTPEPESKAPKKN